ncbi:MAG TPA: tRNA uridine-5-carboxymethylaminomethyl(34) synthesis GTPase MnmE, partial [Nitrospirota bacterium]|nr:tRNA uridine-5-carboxymethylaminomethyl(34) synthesis GTPase MnmE [Nitrospirota bacterium]
MPFAEDTICAVSTPPGMGGIGIVRVSGAGAVGVLGRVFRPSKLPVGGKYRSHRI